jgi:hypothetical protein
VIGIGRAHKPLPADAKKVVFAQDAPYPLVVHFPALPPELGGDPWPPIARELQSNALNGVSQIQLFLAPFHLWVEPV